jgi:hypothetical protein
VAKDLLVDEVHLTVTAPVGLEEAAFRAIRRTLDKKGFQADLRRAIRTVFLQYADLETARLTLSR